MKEKIDRIINVTMETIWLLVIFLIPVYFNFYHSFSVFALGKMVLFRILTEFLLFLFIVKLLFFQVKTKFSLKKLIPFALFFIITAFATFFSPHPYISFWGSFGRHFGLFSILHYFIFFLVLFFCLKDEKQIKKIIFAILLSSFVVSLYAFFQVFDLDPFSWSEKFSKMFRATSTLGQPNFLGAFIVLVFPITIFSFSFLKKFLQRTFLFTLCFLEILTLLFTLSRSAWLGFAGSLFFFSLVFLYFNKRKIIIIFFFLSIIISALFLIGSSRVKINVFWDKPILIRLFTLTNVKSPTAKLRLIVWKSALKIIKERPILGYGLDAQVFPFLKYYSPESIVYEAINTYPDRAHNEILDTLLTTGALGLISYLFLISFIFYQGFKKKSLFSFTLISALFGYLITNQFGFPVTSTYLYFWLYLALIMHECGKENAENTLKINLSFISKIIILLISVATIIILIKYKNINLLKADNYFYQIRKDVKEKNLLKVIDDYGILFNYNPYEASYYRQEMNDILNLTEKFKNEELKKDFLNIALEDANNISEDKENLEFLLLKGQLLNTYGIIDNSKFEEAEKIYLKLSQIAPQMAAIYNDWGRMYILKKDYQKATEKLDKALTLYPINHPDIECCTRKEPIQKEMSVVYYNLGDAYFFQENYDKAIENYTKALKLKPFTVSLHKNLADSYYLKGDIDRTIKENLNGLRLEPKNKEWYENLVLLYKEKGNLDKVKEYNQKILDLSSNEDTKNF